MIIRLVTFTLDGVDDAHYRSLAGAVAPGFAEWTGLDAKLWVTEPASGTYGGVYVFADAAAADASRGTELFAGMMTNPAFTDLTIREFEVLDEPTQVTGGCLAARS
jgi:hypothetical protein